MAKKVNSKMMKRKREEEYCLSFGFLPLLITGGRHLRHAGE